MPSAFVARHWGKIVALVVVGLLALAGAYYLYQQGLTLPMAFAKLKEVAHWAADKSPVYYIAALALLPYVGVPVSLLYLAAGSVYGGAQGVLWTAIGLALNQPLGYLVGKYWLRVPIARMLEKRGHQLPEVPPGEFTKLVVLMRVIPGPPLVIQNFLLAMAGVPFLQYYLYSLPLSLLFGAGILLTGGALFEGNTKLVVFGISLVIALALLAHIANAMYQAKKGK